MNILPVSPNYYCYHVLITASHFLHLAPPLRSTDDDPLGRVKKLHTMKIYLALITGVIRVEKYQSGLHITGPNLDLILGDDVFDLNLSLIAEKIAEMGLSAGDYDYLYDNSKQVIQTNLS